MNLRDAEYLIVADLKISGYVDIDPIKVNALVKYGFTEAIVVNSDNEVLSGQEWLVAARSIGYMTAPCITKI